MYLKCSCPSQNYVRFEIHLVDDLFLFVCLFFRVTLKSNKQMKIVDLRCPIEFQTAFPIGEKENKTQSS